MEQIKLGRLPSSRVIRTEILRHLPHCQCGSAVLPVQISTVFVQCILDKRLQNILYLYCPLSNMKLCLGKEIPIDDISKSYISSPVGINSDLYIIFIWKRCVYLIIDRNTTVLSHLIFRLSYAGYCKTLKMVHCMLLLLRPSHALIAFSERLVPLILKIHKIWNSDFTSEGIHSSNISFKQG